MLVCYQSWLPFVIGIGIGIYSNSHANIYISIWQPYQKYHHGIFISPKIHIDFLHKCPNWDIFEIFTVCRANKKPWNNIGRKMLKMTKHDKSDFHKWWMRKGDGEAQVHTQINKINFQSKYRMKKRFLPNWPENETPSQFYLLFALVGAICK